MTEAELRNVCSEQMLHVSSGAPYRGDEYGTFTKLCFIPDEECRQNGLGRSAFVVAQLRMTDGKDALFLPANIHP